MLRELKYVKISWIKLRESNTYVNCSFISDVYLSKKMNIFRINIWPSFPAKYLLTAWYLYKSNIHMIVEKILIYNISAQHIRIERERVTYSHKLWLKLKNSFGSEQSLCETEIQSEAASAVSTKLIISAERWVVK